MVLIIAFLIGLLGGHLLMSYLIEWMTGGDE